MTSTTAVDPPMAFRRGSRIAQTILSAPSEQRFLVLSGLLFAGAVAGTISNSASMSGLYGTGMPSGRTMSMQPVPSLGEPWLGGVVRFEFMWLLMTVVMMGPSLLPVLWQYRQDLSSLGESLIDRATALVALGYFFVWCLVGAGALVAISVISQAEMQHSLLTQAIPLAGGGVVLAAGMLQLTRWKTHRIACCRKLHWRSAAFAGAVSPWRVGIRVGVRCCLCCANLMAVLLIIGMMDLPTMALTTVAITLERLAPRGARMAEALGIVVAAGGLIMIGRSLG